MYKRRFCTMCEDWAVICPTCLNPSCNGREGSVDGKPCLDCAKAYELMISDSLMDLPLIEEE